MRFIFHGRISTDGDLVGIFLDCCARGRMRETIIRWPDGVTGTQRPCASTVEFGTVMHDQKCEMCGYRNLSARDHE